MQAFFDPFSDHRLIAALTLRLSHNFQSLNHLTGQTYRVGDVFFPLGHLLIKLIRVGLMVFKFEVRSSGFGIRSSGFGVLGLVSVLVWVLVAGRSDRSQLESAGGSLQKVVGWRELHSEFITGLRRYIRHARENVVYLLPVYPLFA